MSALNARQMATYSQVLRSSMSTLSVSPARGAIPSPKPLNGIAVTCRAFSTSPFPDSKGPAKEGEVHDTKIGLQGDTMFQRLKNALGSGRTHIIFGRLEYLDPIEGKVFYAMDEKGLNK